MAAIAVVVVGPQHPALTTDRDLTPEQKTLSAKGEVKSVKLAPGDILGDSPLAQRFFFFSEFISSSKGRTFFRIPREEKKIV